MKNSAERELREQLDKLIQRVQELESRPVFVPQPYPVPVPYWPATPQRPYFVPPFGYEITCGSVSVSTPNS